MNSANTFLSDGALERSQLCSRQTGLDIRGQNLQSEAFLQDSEWGTVVQMSGRTFVTAAPKVLSDKVEEVECRNF